MFRLISKKHCDPVILHGDAWSEITNYGKACLYAMRKHHTKRTNNGGGDKTTEKGAKTKARQRT